MEKGLVTNLEHKTDRVEVQHTTFSVWLTVGPVARRQIRMTLTEASKIGNDLLDAVKERRAIESNGGA